MRNILFFTFVILLFVSSFSLAKEPVKIIFDTDLGGDIDDALTLALIHSLQSRGELELLAVTGSRDNHWVAPMADLINTFYGRPDIPIGVVKNGTGQWDGNHNSQVVNLKDSEGKPLFPCRITPETEVPDAYLLIRKVLAAQEEDQQVVIIQVGGFTNLQRLLDSPGDEYSPLNGYDLVKKKVKYASIMAGAFEKSYFDLKESNVIADLPAARKMIEKWPTEIIFNGAEIGVFILFPYISIDEDFGYLPVHPIREAHRFFTDSTQDQTTFDLNSVLYTARPNRGYYSLSEPGTVSFTEEGITVFVPDANGKHRFMTVDDRQIAVAREALIQLTTQPPVFLIEQPK